MAISGPVTEVLDTVAAIVLLESGAQCSDRERARAALNDALLGARAPSHAGQRPHGSRSTPEATGEWTVSMAVAHAASGGRLVEASIRDDGGTVVAERTLSDRGVGGCLPLARAVGAWASLVLDAELNRAQDDAPAPAFVTTTSVVTSSSRAAPAATSEPDVPPAGADRPKHIELGTMVYIRNGLTTTGGMTGLTPFVTFEVAPSWVLRPALYFGRSTEGLADGTGNTRVVSHLGTRVDFCRRIPGNYVDRRGIEADVCGGVEAGIVTPTTDVLTSAFRLGTGPSVDLRGELGAGAALELRGLVGANLLSFASGGQTPLVFASAEVGVSVRLR